MNTSAEAWISKRKFGNLKAPGEDDSDDDDAAAMIGLDKSPNTRHVMKEDFKKQ